MTAAHEPNEIDGPHEGPIKTPKQLILAVFYAFVVPIFGIILLVMYVTTETRPAAGSDARAPKSIAERIRPVGTVEIKDATDVASMKTGEQVYAAQCTACHATGALNAPEARRRRRLGAAHQGRLRRPAPLGAGRQGPDAGAGRRRLQRLRDRPRGGLHGQPGRRQAPRAGGAGRRRLGSGGDDRRGRAAATPVAAAPAAPATPRRAAAPAAPAAAEAAAGAIPALYTQACSVCHAAGVAGAPKIGDKAAWAPRLAQGVDALVASVVKGKGAMPPRGGSTASDAEIKAVVTWMVGQAK